MRLLSPLDSLSATPAVRPTSPVAASLPSLAGFPKGAEKPQVPYVPESMKRATRPAAPDCADEPESAGDRHPTSPKFTRICDASPTLRRFRRQFPLRHADRLCHHFELRLVRRRLVRLDRLRNRHLRHRRLRRRRLFGLRLRTATVSTCSAIPPAFAIAIATRIRAPTALRGRPCDRSTIRCSPRRRRRRRRRPTASRSPLRPRRSAGDADVEYRSLIEPARFARSFAARERGRHRTVPDAKSADITPGPCDVRALPLFASSSHHFFGSFCRLNSSASKGSRGIGVIAGGAGIDVVGLRDGIAGGIAGGMPERRHRGRHCGRHGRRKRGRRRARTSRLRGEGIARMRRWPDLRCGSNFFAVIVLGGRRRPIRLLTRGGRRPANLDEMRIHRDELIHPCLHRLERHALSAVERGLRRAAVSDDGLDEQRTQDRLFDVHVFQDGGQVPLGRRPIVPLVRLLEHERGRFSGMMARPARVHQDRLHPGRERHERVVRDVERRRCRGRRLDRCRGRRRRGGLRGLRRGLRRADAQPLQDLHELHGFGMIGPHVEGDAGLRVSAILEAVAVAPAGETEPFVGIAEVGLSLHEDEGFVEIAAEATGAVAGNPEFADGPANAVAIADAFDFAFQQTIVFEQEHAALVEIGRSSRDARRQRRQASSSAAGAVGEYSTGGAERQGRRRRQRRRQRQAAGPVAPRSDRRRQGPPKGRSRSRRKFSCRAAYTGRAIFGQVRSIDPYRRIGRTIGFWRSVWSPLPPPAIESSLATEFAGGGEG